MCSQSKGIGSADISAVNLQQNSVPFRRCFTVLRIGGITTQAQRPGPRDAPIATATLTPGSLQRIDAHLRYPITLK